MQSFGGVLTNPSPSHLSHSGRREQAEVLRLLQDLALCPPSGNATVLLPDPKVLKKKFSFEQREEKSHSC